jgi:hypothetical protein
MLTVWMSETELHDFNNGIVARGHVKPNTYQSNKIVIPVSCLLKVEKNIVIVQKQN